jgi:isoleucyl-tRNA synthetase
VRRDFRVPEGVAPGDVDANGDGEVLVALDLRTDEGLESAGLAREVVNRVQKLRKKAGLSAGDAVEAFVDVSGAPEEAEARRALLAVLDARADYIRCEPETLRERSRMWRERREIEGQGSGEHNG